MATKCLKYDAWGKCIEWGKDSEGKPVMILKKSSECKIKDLEILKKAILEKDLTIQIPAD
jgi:hypothetical protein